MQINLHCVSQFGHYTCVLEAAVRNWDINLTRVVTDTGSLTELETCTLTHTWTHRTQETGKTNDIFCISCIIPAMSVSTIHKDQLPSTPHTHRNEIVQCSLNNHFSVQLNSCWRSSLLSLLSENSRLPLFNPLRGSRREGERKRETSIECWQGHNLPSLHTLFTVSLPAAIPSSLNGAIKNK